MSMIDVIVVTYNNAESVRRCLETARMSFGKLLGRIHVVENASTDGTLALLEEEREKSGGALVIHPQKENRGFAAGVNIGAAASKAPFFFLLNPDAEFERGNRWDVLLKDLDQRPSAAAIGVEVRSKDGRTQASAYSFPRLERIFLEVSGMNEWIKGVCGERTMPQSPESVDYVQGSAVLIRRSAWEHVGPLDERYFLYHEEMDWCFRAKRRGYVVLYWPTISLIHYGGWRVPPGREEVYYQSLLRFFEKNDRPRLERVREWIVRGARLRLWFLKKRTDEESHLKREGLERLLLTLDSEDSGSFYQ